MVDTLIWIVIIISFIASFAGIIFPVIPSPLMAWIGFLLYFFFLNDNNLSVLFWLAMVILTVILIISDIIANSFFVKKYGGTKWGERIAAIAVIAGSFIFPPFGIILVPLAAVFITEMLQQRTAKEAIRASLGSLFGFLGGALAKVLILLLMFGWFFIDI